MRRTEKDRRKKDDLFARRRARFAEGLKEGVALFFAAPEARFGHDIHHRYRPDPDLYYLTGFPEPDAVAVLDAEKKRLVLFVRPRDRERETWDGRRAGPEGALRDFGADAAHPIDELPRRLPDLVRGANVLHHAFGQNHDADLKVAEMLARFRRESRSRRRGPILVSDPTNLLHEMRLFKEPAEVDLLARSAEIAAAAHRDAMALTAPGVFEYELEGAVERRFRAEGASGPSYPTIAASGPNATILHYVENRRRIEEDDLVLLDAGCEFEGYAADITRTFPANGRFTRTARRFYDVVLRAQKAAIAAVAPGTTLDAVHEAGRAVMIEGLLSLGLLSGKRRSVASIARKNGDSRFVIHRTSHWLGLDVHDRGRYMTAEGKPRPLEPGMVLTVEPGLYVREDEKRVPPAFLGLGVRIEDDLLVTREGSRVLTANAPKEIEELEAIVGKKAKRGRRR